MMKALHKRGSALQQYAQRQQLEMSKCGIDRDLW